MQTIKLYGGIRSANPLKIGLILTVLDLPYESVPVDRADLKKPAYEAINPNGRLPSIHDPNTGLTIWESGAIIQYLIERYDAEEPRKLSFPPGSGEAELARSFLFFQVSGQGPYYGQAYWFKFYHHEKVPSAIERYINEAKRVTGVLDKWLSQQKEANSDNLGNGPWLVGNRMSYVDIAFIPWQLGAHKVFAQEGVDVNSFPHEKEWTERMANMEPIKKVLESEEAGLR